MRTLIVNTYAGSLLLGASAIDGANIFGSYEDCGFGANVTKANGHRWPGIEFVDHIKQWPDQDLTDTVILAHPPCAAFSQQNTSKTKRGVNTEAFECTRKVLKYGMTNGAAAIAVESVMGALGGAWDVYDHMSETGGYHVYRILKNSILFGVPQFRERFWAVLIRKDLIDGPMEWRLAPKFATVGAVVDPILPGTPLESLSKTITKFVDKLVREHGLDEARVREVGLQHHEGHKRIGFARFIQKEFFPDMDPAVVLRKYISPFTSGQPSILSPGCYSPVLLGSSLWVYRGKPMPQEGYKAIMGFPTDYVFPPDNHYGMRTFLSKGVCPPVATWILDNILNNLGAPHRQSDFTRYDGYVKMVAPGHIGSFRPGRLTILQRYEDMVGYGTPASDELMDLRNEEEHLEEVE